MTYIIYKDLSGYKMTTEDNYNARIQNLRRVVDYSAFKSPEEVKAYVIKYFDPEEVDTYIIKC